MKLLYCKECLDVISLQFYVRKCRCEKTGGRYVGILNAVYFGDSAVPLGFANQQFLYAIRNQPESGLGEDFPAFIIPKKCNTFIKLPEQEIETASNLLFH